METTITPQDFSEIRWRGHWIWTTLPSPGNLLPGSGPAAPLPEAHGLFRKTFVLGDVPARAPARISADSRYLLFVNGQEVSRGPIRSQPQRLHYDLFDLAPYLRSGENVVAVYAKYYGTAKSYWMPAVPNATLGKSGVLVFEANVGPSADAEDGWLVSDASWKTIESDAWAAPPADGGPVGGGVPVEVFDARTFPLGWQDAGFDDASWGNAHKIPAMHIGGFAHTQPPTHPYGPMYPRPIAPLGGEACLPVTIQVETLQDAFDLSAHGPATRVGSSFTAGVVSSESASGCPVPLTVPSDGAVRLVLDMGRIVSGFVDFELEAPAGTVLDLCYVEDPITDPTGRGFGRHAGTRYIARGKEDSFQVFDSNGLRYVYLLVHGATGPVILKRFAIREHIYPWTAGASYACSDETLNQLYQAGIRTVQLNSHDAFLDCPTREQRGWVGDAVVHQMVHLATNLDWRLAWQYLTLGNSPRSDGILPMSVSGDIESSHGMTIPDWSLHWVHGVYNLYRFLGDRKWIKSFMPTVEGILRWYVPYQTSEGVLKDLTEWNLVDWASISVEDTSGVITALWARGLREFAEMAEWLGENASREWAEELYAKAKEGFELFWDEERGSYVDHIVAGVRRPEMSQLGGAFGIVSELAPRERWERIVDTITDPDKLVVRSWTGGGDGDYSQEKIRKQMQGIYEPDWEVETEVVIGEPFISYVVHDAVAKAGKADRLPDLYPRWTQFLVDGYDTIGECWGWGTHVHGWSCTPTKDMVFYTLGITPTEPGYAVARIAPRLGRLEWAKGTVPTPHGLIAVDVTADTVTIDSPVPVLLDLKGQEPRQLEAGHHEVSI